MKASTVLQSVVVEQVAQNVKVLRTAGPVFYGNPGQRQMGSCHGIGFPVEWLPLWGDTADQRQNLSGIVASVR